MGIEEQTNVAVGGTTIVGEETKQGGGGDACEQAHDLTSWRSFIRARTI
jgi:hypothetical protein